MFGIFSKFHNIHLFKPKPISTAQTPPKTALEFENIRNYKILSKTPVRYKYGKGYITTTTTNAKVNKEAIRVNSIIIDCDNFPIAKYEYNINKSNAIIDNGYIETKHSERRSGLGEILRLSSLIEFKENKIKFLDIDALCDAVPFHLKYKLKPNLTTQYETLKILSDITGNSNVHPIYRKKAKYLIQKIEHENTVTLSQKSQRIINNFIEKFVKQHLHNWKDAQFTLFLPMQLTESRLKQFAGFYNKLFKKHGIDYQI